MTIILPTPYFGTESKTTYNTARLQLWLTRHSLYGITSTLTITFTLTITLTLTMTLILTITPTLTIMLTVTTTLLWHQKTPCLYSNYFNCDSDNPTSTWLFQLWQWTCFGQICRIFSTVTCCIIFTLDPSLLINILLWQSEPVLAVVPASILEIPKAAVARMIKTPVASSRPAVAAPTIISTLVTVAKELTPMDCPSASPIREQQSQ